MGSEFGSVIIDDVWQCQAAADGFTPGCLCIKIFHGNCEQAEVTFLLNMPSVVVKKTVAQVCSIINQ